MILLTLRAYALLLSFEFVVSRRDFPRLYERVRNRAICPRTSRPDACARACGAVDWACAFYFKEMQCLQRSAAAVCLLRALGVPASLVIGAQQLPFRAHAWVEVEGKVVNDKHDVSQTYAVLDRC
jgi:Transglutaminase-like superfamily